MVAATQSETAGVPLPEVEGSCIAPNEFPPNSPVTNPRWVPGATAIPSVPASKLMNSGNDCTCDGALQVPAGDPAVNVAWVRSAMNRFPENSIADNAIPVVQSSAAESNLPPGLDTGFSKTPVLEPNLINS